MSIIFVWYYISVSIALPFMLFALKSNGNISGEWHFSYSTAQHNVLDWQRHAARRMIHHYLEVDMFYQVGLNRICRDITRWRGDMNFMFEWQEQYFTSERSEWVRYCSCHENIKFILQGCYSGRIWLLIFCFGPISLSHKLLWDETCSRFLLICN